MHDALRQLTGTLLVTGGMGFLGSNFVRHILREHPTTRVVNLDKVTYAGESPQSGRDCGDSRYTFVQAVEWYRRHEGWWQEISPWSTGRTIAFSTASAPHERADTVGG